MNRPPLPDLKLTRTELDLRLYRDATRVLNLNSGEYKFYPKKKLDSNSAKNLTTKNPDNYDLSPTQPENSPQNATFEGISEATSIDLDYYDISPTQPQPQQENSPQNATCERVCKVASTCGIS